MDARMRTDVRTDEHSLLVREGSERAEYFRRARAFLHDHPFETADDRRVWAQHANGASVDAIERATELPHSRVQRTIERLAAAMLRPRRGPGRRPHPGGRSSRTAYLLAFRLSDTEAEAFFSMLAALEMPQRRRAELARLALLMGLTQLRRNLVNHKPGTPVPGGNGSGERG